MARNDLKLLKLELIVGEGTLDLSLGVFECGPRHNSGKDVAAPGLDLHGEREGHMRHSTPHALGAEVVLGRREVVGVGELEVAALVVAVDEGALEGAVRAERGRVVIGYLNVVTGDDL